MDVGKEVLNHYKFGFCFLYPYLFNLFLLHQIKDLLLCKKFLRKPIHPPPPPLLVRLLCHIELSAALQDVVKLYFIKAHQQYVVVASSKILLVLRCKKA